MLISYSDKKKKKSSPYLTRLKSGTAVLTFTFLSFPFLSLLTPYFFSKHLLRFIRLETFWGKRFRMVGLDEIKCRWVEEQDFHWNFQLNFRLRIFLFYAALTESCLFEYALKVFFLQVGYQSCI